MAEIKSTMDLVMERAARIGRASSEELRREEARTKGMQLTGEYLDGKLERLTDELPGQESAAPDSLRQGMVESLMRNIFLARDDLQRDRVEKAFQGIIDLGGKAGDVVSICRELLTILDGYTKHRKQLRAQLEEQVRMQYEQLLAQQTGGQPGKLNIDVTMQPKFMEEWGRIEAELKDQYSQALEQYKVQLKQRLGIP